MDILEVNMERWKEAQKWEKKLWVKTQRVGARYGKNFIWKILATFGLKPKYRGSDYNEWWKKHFNDYNFLPSVLDNIIELGCGPFTNMRYITEVCKPKHLFLSDPLIKTYVNFKLNFVSEIYKKGFCILDDHPIEECPFNVNYFDLVVIINVLDHVRNANFCMEQIIRIIKPNGILIFGQDLRNEEGIENDIGHPIRINSEWIDNFLRNNFKAVIFKILPCEQSRSPHEHYGTYIFAGKKLNIV